MTPTERVVAAWQAMENRERDRLTGRHQTAALASALQALTVETSDETTCVDHHIAALVRTPGHAYRDMLRALWQAGLSGQVPATTYPPGPAHPPTTED